MKIGLLIVVLLLRSGSTVFQAQTQNTQNESSKKLLSETEIHQIEERLPWLWEGMTSAEIYEVLGVHLSKRAYGVWGSGHSNAYATVYQMKGEETGFNVVLVRDEKQQLVRAYIPEGSKRKKP